MKSISLVIPLFIILCMVDTFNGVRLSGPRVTLIYKGSTIILLGRIRLKRHVVWPIPQAVQTYVFILARVVAWQEAISPQQEATSASTEKEM